MASMLIKEFRTPKKAVFDEKAVEVICAISGIPKEKESETDRQKKITKLNEY
jgi:hypothetical protein